VGSDVVGRPRGARWLAGAAIVALAAVAAVLVVRMHGSPSQRTVRIAVYGTRPVTVPQQPGIAYGGAGHMIPPTRRSSTAQQSPTDAALVLTTPAGRTRQTDQTLPWQQTITLRPGQQVSVSVRSATATSLECTITVDGAEVAKQDASTRSGTVTCQARS
jgi:hypothetical protein